MNFLKLIFMFFITFIVTHMAYGNGGGEPTGLEQKIISAIVDFVMANPRLAIVFSTMAVARSFFKPLMTLAEKYVATTSTKTDDEKLTKFKQSKFYKAVGFICDFLLSIKLPQAKK